jgi:hypothetical protein
MRQIYREYYHLTPRFEPAEAVASFKAAGVAVRSSLACIDIYAPMINAASLMPDRTGQASSDLGGFTRWMTGASPDEDLPSDLQERVLTFLESKRENSLVHLRLVDLVITGVAS